MGGHIHQQWGRHEVVFREGNYTQTLGLHLKRSKVRNWATHTRTERTPRKWCASRKPPRASAGAGPRFVRKIWQNGLKNEGIREIPLWRYGKGIPPEKVFPKLRLRYVTAGPQIHLKSVWVLQISFFLSNDTFSRNFC